MVEEVLKYPDERINIGSGNVRFFDEELWELIENLKETAQAHKSKGLAAIQVAVPLAVVVVKNEDDDWLELINPRIIKHKGNITSKETTLYLPDVEEEIPRFESISIVYQDRNGNQHAMVAEGSFGCLLQRKIDYIYGGTFMNKLGRDKMKETQKSYAQSGINGDFNSCPTFSKREYFKSAINKLLFFEAIAMTTPFYVKSAATLLLVYHFIQVATALIIVLIVSYMAYAHYEAKKYAACTGCQAVGVTAIALKYFVASMVLFMGGYFWINPN